MHEPLDVREGPILRVAMGHQAQRSNHALAAFIDMTKLDDERALPNTEASEDLRGPNREDDSARGAAAVRRVLRPEGREALARTCPRRRSPMNAEKTFSVRRVYRDFSAAVGELCSGTLMTS